jgi:hypothetical protein
MHGFRHVLPIILDRRWLAALFLFCALPAGLCLALLTPMGQVADEPAHIARAAGLLHGQIMGQRVIVHDAAAKRSFALSGTGVNTALVAASLAELPSSHLGPLTAAEARAARAIPWSRQRQFDTAPNTVQYFPALYLPGTLGIALTRVLGGSPLQALYGGRIAMLLSYLAIGGIAIGMARFGHGLILALLCLPMSLGLGASFNQDGQLIAASALTGALLTLDPVSDGRCRLWAFPVFALVLCSKPPYGLLLFAALCPLASPGLLRRLARVALFALPPVIWVVLMMHFAETPYLRPPYHPGPLWAGNPIAILHGSDPAANFGILLAKPSRFLHIPIRFMQDEWWFLVRQAVGWLGWLTVPLAPWAYTGWFIALACALASVMLGQDSQAASWHLRDALFVLALIIITGFAVDIAIYLSWDRVGQAYITGVQGRYYLLFVPFLMLALPRFNARFAGAVLTLPAVAMALVDIGYLPWLVVQRFYLH